MIALPAYPTPVPMACETISEWSADPVVPPSSSTFTVLGYTYWQGGTAMTIRLAPRVCLGLLLLALDPTGAQDGLNPQINVPAEEALAVLTLEHETGHALTGMDETNAECYGIGHVWGELAAMDVPTARASTMAADAQADDATLPAVYHERTCP